MLMRSKDMTFQSWNFRHFVFGTLGHFQSLLQAIYYDHPIGFKKFNEIENFGKRFFSDCC